MRNTKGQFIKGSLPFNTGTHITNSGSFKQGHKLLGKSIGEIMKGKPSPKKGIQSLKTMGSKNGNWKDGASKQNRTERQNIMSTLEYKLWRKSCFERDNFTCQISGQSGGKLVVHHINNFSEFSELRTAIDNGFTMTKELHIKFHKIYGKRNSIF